MKLQIFSEKIFLPCIFLGVLDRFFSENRSRKILFPSERDNFSSKVEVLYVSAFSYEWLT